MSLSIPLPCIGRLRAALRLAVLVPLLLPVLTRAAAATAPQDFLDPDQAFELRAALPDPASLAVSWKIAPGYKLYRHALSVETAGGTTAQLQLPPAHTAFDAALGRQVDTYREAVTARVALPAGAAPLEVAVGYQGCADGGLCYPPQSRRFRIDPAAGTVAALDPPEQGNGLVPVATTTPAPAPVVSDAPLSAESVLRGGSLPRIALAFVLFGLLLSLTPCVLPMLPILSTIILGEKDPGRGRGLLLAGSYALGMASVYTGMGVAAGLVGEGLAAFLQQPWVLVLFASLLALMALSMFDVFQLQLPAAWQGRLSAASGRLRGGRVASVFAMGAVSSLIVGPCVAGPMAGALLYISQTRDVAIGALALFAMACGMSMPLLLTGWSAGRLLPRAGAWMQHVKSFFGFLLLAVALWMLNPLLGPSVRLLAWGALLVLAAWFTPLAAPRAGSEGFGARAARAAGVLLLVTGLAEIAGGLMGNDDAFAPLRQPASTVQAAGPARGQGLAFETVRSAGDLDRILRASDRPVMLDFYADWCASCLEMQRFTFSDPQVLQQAQPLRRLKVDVTRNTPDDRELLRRFRLFGPPGLVFFDARGQELQELRVVGSMPAETFGAHLRKVVQHAQAAAPAPLP
jgi:thiol:disulfide interchange protein DsbD